MYTKSDILLGCSIVIIALLIYIVGGEQVLGFIIAMVIILCPLMFVGKILSSDKFDMSSVAGFILGGFSAKHNIDKSNQNIERRNSKADSLNKQQMEDARKRNPNYIDKR